MTLVFQASLHQGAVPSDSSYALVTPLFKKGNRSEASNYRPISLTSIACKCLEHIINHHVMSHLDRYSILHEEQHGFRKGRSCESQLILTIQDLAKGLDDGSQIDAILLDFSKAFDKVSHQRLLGLCKLNHYGVRGQVLNWITSFLAECRVLALPLQPACHQWRPTGDSTGITSFPRLHQRSTFLSPVHTKAVCR